MTAAGALALVAFLAAFVIPYAATVLWVYRDAGRRGSDRARAWGAGTFLAAPAFPFVFLAYLLLRPRPDDLPSAERLDRLLRNVAVAVVLVFVGVMRAAPPDPLSQASALAVVLPIAVLVGLLFTYRDVLVGAVRGR